MTEQIMMDLHDMSVSGDKRSESVARLMKQTIAGSLDWLEDERQRGTLPHDVIDAMIRAHVGIANIITAHNFEIRQQTMDAMGKAYGMAFSSYAKSLATVEAKHKRKRDAS